MNPVIPLNECTDMHKKASSGDVRAEIGVREVKIPKVGGIKIFGDSLSDPGGKNGMYNKKILGCIPLSLFLHKSLHKQFTNGFVWDYAFNEALEFSRESFNPINNPNLLPLRGFFKSENRAQGGAMAYNYGSFSNLFRFLLKGLLLSFFVTNMQSEAEKLKKDKNSKLNPADLCIIFAGANDLVTAGYCDKGGAERAIEGIAKTIEVLTTSQEKDNSNYAKNILAFTLPDFSKTPRFSKKSEKQRKQAQEACRIFNEGLRGLAKNYQYLDFTLCDIYQVDKKEDIDLAKIKEKGVIITGSGSTRKVYFVDKEKYILRDDKEISIDIKLSKAEKKLLGEERGQILRNENIVGLEELIHKLSSKAKLNADVKIFDAAAVFEKIDENPEAYGFTSGCAVYYLDKNQDKECIPKDITSGNAIIIKEINQEYNKQKGLPAELCCYYVKDGKLIEHGTGSMKLPSITQFTLSEEDKNEFIEKIKQHPLKKGIGQLVGPEDKHDPWTTHIVQSSVGAYEKKFKEKIQLADIYASVLLAIKEHLPNQQVLFWDDLHPSVMVHFLLETAFKQFFMDNYSVKNPRFWRDDMAFLERVSPKIESSPRAAEAPAELPSSMRLRGSW